MGNITPDLNKIGFRKERPNYGSGYVARYSNSFRVGFPVSTDSYLPATECLTFDKADGDLDIPEPLLKKEELNVIGDGRNTADIVEMGYETVEQAITVNAQTGIFIYYAIGGCISTGTALDPAISDATVTRASATSIGGFENLTPSAHVGRIASVSNGTYANWVWVITANDETTLTVNTPLPADFATSNTGGSPTVVVLGTPFTHTISEPSTATQVTNGSQMYLPSLILHIENSDGTRTKYKDLIGVLVKSLKITLEKGAKTMYEVTLLVPKSIAGVIQTAYPTYAYSGDTTRAVLSYNTDEFFTWEHLDTTNSYFKVGSAHIFGSTLNWINETFKIEITIDNEVSIDPVLGDAYPNKILVGKRDYTIVMGYYPTSNEIAGLIDTTVRFLYDCKQAALSAYTDEISLLVRFGRPKTSTYDYIQLLFSSLYVTEYPDKLVNIETKEVAVDVTLKNAPASTNIVAGTCVATVVDDRNPSYYGDT
jgi:hypothetical protein